MPPSWRTGWPSAKKWRMAGRSGLISISTTSDGEVRNARAMIVCGAMGTQTMPVNSGVTMGPPAARA